MDKRVTDKQALAVPVRKKGYRWVRSERVAEIALRGWTDDGKLQHASYKGLREDANEASVLSMPQET